jgi:predicted short-subunit dehydrogenase-like oxidoreductase (DUF2520 family)
MKVAVVGAGRVGTAFAVLLGRAGHAIVGVSGRGPTRERAARHLPQAAFLEPAATAGAGELVLLGVPDDLIAATAADLAAQGAFRPGQYVAHLSGARGLDVLEPARAAGARRLGIHPLQTFPDVGHALDRIPGCTVAVSADDEDGYFVAERIADDVLGEPFRLSEDLRPLYHAAAVFASNYLVTTTAVAARLFSAAGIADPDAAMAPLQQATLDNLRDLGPAKALTGPASRGDAGTVERNLEALDAHARDAVAAYVAMARVALDLATASGSLDPERRTAVEGVLDRWS